MKKFISIFLVVVFMFSFVGCGDKEAEAATVAAMELVDKYYTVFDSAFLEYSDATISEHTEPTINKVEKISDGYYLVNGSICGVHGQGTVTKGWQADWEIKMKKNYLGEYEYSGTPDYGEIVYFKD